MKADVLIDFTASFDQGALAEEEVYYNTDWRVITIDFAPICNLADCDFYRLLALQIIPQIAKIGEVRHPLNIPVPSTAADSFDFIRQLLRLNLGRVIYMLKNTHMLSYERNQRISDFIDKMRTTQEYYANRELVRVIWQKRNLPKRF